MSKQKIITAVELRKKDEKSLLALLQETSQNDAKMILDLVMGKTKNTCGRRPLSRTIARIKTVLAEKQDFRLLTEKKV
ncbi:MAG: 50S ribosomal protein L29 [Candidatus Roizmanbacteria bacterium]|nr:50S ribosomal protein L29 [Candidatus Roizmanbacteria bacterium]